MYAIETSIDIDAPPARVWAVLTAFREYDEWNPVITRIRAVLSPGTPIVFVIVVGKREMKIKGEMLRVQAERELCWFGPASPLLGRVFRGEHFLKLEPRGGATRLIHGEQFQGFSLPLLWRRMKPDLERAYQEMNQAVKARVEAAGKPQPA